MAQRNRTRQGEAAEQRGSVWFIGFAVLTLALYAFFGWMVVGDAGLSGSEVVHVAGAISFFGIIAVGLLPSMIAPMRNVAAFQQALAAGLAVLALALIVGDPNNRGGQAGPFDPTYAIFLIPLIILAILHPARRELMKAGRLRPLLLLAAVVMAVPLFIYGVDQALTQRNSWPPKSDPHHNSHWATMAQLAFAIPLTAAAAGLGARGWRVPAWTATSVLAVLGAVSVVFPDAASSLGIGWGVAAVVAAAVIAVLVGRRPRA